MSCTEKKSRENDCRRIIWLRTAGGKDQRNQNGRTDRTEYFRDSERKVSGDYRRTMGKLYGQVLQELLEEKKSKVRSREKNNRSGRENFTAGFLKLRSGI